MEILTQLTQLEASGIPGAKGKVEIVLSESMESWSHDAEAGPRKLWSFLRGMQLWSEK